MRIVVVDGATLNPGDLSWEALGGFARFEIYPRSTPQEILERCHDAEAVITNKTSFDSAIIAALPELKYIGVSATGYNIVDIDAASERGIVVTNVPTYGTLSVAQMVFALLLELTQHAGHHSQTVHEGRWANCDNFCYWDYPLVELGGLVMGGELDIYETNREEILYLKNSGRFYTDESISLSEFFESITAISASVIKADGKVVKLKETDFKTVDSPPSSWVFHDDDKEVIFDFKELREGYRTVIEYTKKVKKSEFFDVFHFVSGFPVEYSKVQISYPQTVELTFYERAFKNFPIVRTETTDKKGIRTTTWEYKNIPAFKTEAGSTKSLTPQRICGELPSRTFATLRALMASCLLTTALLRNRIPMKTTLSAGTTIIQSSGTSKASIL